MSKFRKGEMESVLLNLTPELVKVIDVARGSAGRAAFIEHLCWQVKSIKEAAAALGVKNPQRPLESRGRPKNPEAGK